MKSKVSPLSRHEFSKHSVIHRTVVSPAVRGKGGDLRQQIQPGLDGDNQRRIG